MPLSQSFVSYLGADGIVLPPEGNEDGTDDAEFESTPGAAQPRIDPHAGEEDSDGEDSDSSSDEDPSREWHDVHTAIHDTIRELGGKVVPKLNWSSPKDATWINPTNSMDCRTPNDIYLMLKSSDFITHDLEHWSDDCEPVGEDDDDNDDTTLEPLQYTLMLRKHVQINPSVEFRCFVRRRQLIGMCQRDMNHFDFLFEMVPALRSLIQDFFDEKLRNTFPDDNYAFDVYIPAPHQRVWLIDINPWAQRTDPLLFSWLELLTMEIPETIGVPDESTPEIVRLQIRENADGSEMSRAREMLQAAEDAGAEDSDVEDLFTPEFRLIKKDDPEAYSFNTPQYSAHKLPKDVVEASQSGPGPLREFANQWKEALDRQSQR